jgi:hypothetical protein
MFAWLHPSWACSWPCLRRSHRMRFERHHELDDQRARGTRGHRGLRELGERAAGPIVPALRLDHVAGLPRPGLSHGPVRRPGGSPDMGIRRRPRPGPRAGDDHGGHPDRERDHGRVLRVQPVSDAYVVYDPMAWIFLPASSDPSTTSAGRRKRSSIGAPRTCCECSRLARPDAPIPRSTIWPRSNSRPGGASVAPNSRNHTSTWAPPHAGPKGRDRGLLLSQ